MTQMKQGETLAEREDRLGCERAMLAEADADLANGRYLAGAPLDEWLQAFVGDGKLPSPEALRARHRGR